MEAGTNRRNGRVTGGMKGQKKENRGRKVEK